MNLRTDAPYSVYILYEIPVVLPIHWSVLGQAVLQKVSVRIIMSGAYYPA